MYPQWFKDEFHSDRRKWTVTAVAAVILLGLGFGLSLVSLSRRETMTYGTFHPDKVLDVHGMHGAVACDIPQCSQMGVDVLKSGGNAVDAVVQVALCVGSMAPQSAGIGGGGFITFRFPNGTALSIDCRETAPARAEKHMFDTKPELSKVGGLASGVPGEVAGLHKLWEMGGSIPWKELVVPVADLNDRGFPANEPLVKVGKYYSQTVGADLFARLISESNWGWLFGKNGGVPAVGRELFRPQLAHTLRVIAHEGPQAFYRGKIAESLVNTTQKLGGVLTLEDFANYTVDVKPSLQGEFMGKKVFTSSAPSSGPALLMALATADEIVQGSEGDAVTDQRIIEIMKWMAAARSQLGDPAFVSNPKMAEMLTADWVANVASEINDDHTLTSWRDYHPAYEMTEPHGTTHFSVIDGNGMAVAMTSTVNLPFGNLVCDYDTGIIMNSEMDDFSVPRTSNSFELAPSIYNFVAPGKRPLSSAVPSIIVGDNEVEMAIGAAGGSRILTSVFLALVRVYAQNCTGLEAVSFPRFHHQLIPNQLMFEPGFPSGRESEWEQRGHEIEERLPASTMNLVYRSGDLHAVSDFYRKRGMGAAY